MGGSYSASSFLDVNLGDAVIQVDPESRSLVVIADEETHAQIMKIVKDLDRPKPQVLIKVLFVEVTYSNGLDVGIEGALNFNREQWEFEG